MSNSSVYFARQLRHQVMVETRATKRRRLQATLDDVFGFIDRGEEGEICALTTANPGLFALRSLVGSRSPLHWVAQKRTISLETLRKVYEADPTALYHVDSLQRTPIHCAAGKATIPILQFLLDAWNNGNKIRSSSTTTNTSKSTVSILMDACLTAACTSNDQQMIDFLIKGKLKIHYDAAITQSDHDSNSAPSALYRLCGRRDHEFPLKFFITLAMIYPNACAQKLSTQKLPLDLALALPPKLLVRRPLSLDIIRFLLEVYPESLWASPFVVRNILWNRRFVRQNEDLCHFLFEFACQLTCGKDTWNRFPLACALRLSDKIQRKSRNGGCGSASCDGWSRSRIEKSLGYQKFLDRCLQMKGGSTVRTKFRNGRLPLHLTLSYRSSTSIVERMLELEPRAALIRDPETGLWPFLLASCTCRKKERRVDIIYRMLRLNPSSFIGDALRRARTANASPPLPLSPQNQQVQVFETQEEIERTNDSQQLVSKDAV